MWGIGSRTTKDTKICVCPSPLCKIIYLCIIYAHLCVYFKSLECLQYLIQCKCYMNISFAFWKFLEFPYSEYFPCGLVQFVDIEPTDS